MFSKHIIENCCKIDFEIPQAYVFIPNMLKKTLIRNPIKSGVTDPGSSHNMIIKYPLKAVKLTVYVKTIVKIVVFCPLV